MEEVLIILFLVSFVLMFFVYIIVLIFCNLNALTKRVSRLEIQTKCSCQGYYSFLMYQSITFVLKILLKLVPCFYFELQWTRRPRGANGPGSARATRTSPEQHNVRCTSPSTRHNHSFVSQFVVKLNFGLGYVRTLMIGLIFFLRNRNMSIVKYEF